MHYLDWTNTIALAYSLIFIPSATKLGGIKRSLCPSFCPSVHPSVCLMPVAQNGQFLSARKSGTDCAIQLFICNFQQIVLVT